MTRKRSKGWLRLFVLLAFLAGLTALVGHQIRLGYQTPLNCCVEDSGTGGGRGLALWAERMGWPARPLREPLWEAVELLQPATGNCILTAGDGPWSPWDEQLSPEQWEKISRWVQRGNTLLILTGAPDQLPVPVAKAWGGGQKEDFARQIKESIHLGSSARLEPNPRTSRVRVPWGGYLEVRADGPRGPNPVVARSPDHATTWQVAGGVLYRASWGQGALYVVLDDYAWTNAGLDHADNAKILAETLARELRGGLLAVDEYRHGRGRVESFASLLGTVPGAATFLKIAAVLGLLYVYRRNVRFGPPEDYLLPERRTAREYIEAVAQLYQRARAAPLAVEAVARRVRLLAAHRGHLASETEQVIQEAQQYVAKGSRPAKPTEACRLITELVRQRKQWYGTHSDS
jgi:hypothetical protein